MPDLSTVAQGISASFVATVRDSAGNPYTAYDGTEALAGTVRVGRDSIPLITLAPTWADHTKGTIAVPVPGSASVGLDVGRYLVQLKLADNTADLYEGFLEVTYSPGSAAALPFYGAFGDMLDRATWAEKLQRPTDLAGFARQRYLARKWFEDIMHRHYRGTSGFSTDSTFGFWAPFGGRFGPRTRFRAGGRSKELQTWLDAGGLDVTEQVIEAVSCYAIALVCERQIAPGKDDNGYGGLTRKFFARAENAATNLTAEIDTNADGVNDIVIRLGIADTLEG